MAQQQIGQGTTKEIREAILNVSVLIGGRNGPMFHGPVASMLNVSPEDIEGLDRGRLHPHLSGVPPLSIPHPQAPLGQRAPHERQRMGSGQS